MIGRAWEIERRQCDRCGAKALDGLTTPNDRKEAMKTVPFQNCFVVSSDCPDCAFDLALCKQCLAEAIAVLRDLE